MAMTDAVLTPTCSPCSRCRLPGHCRHAAMICSPAAMPTMPSMKPPMAGHMAVAPLEEKFWQLFCQAIDARPCSALRRYRKSSTAPGTGRPFRQPDAGVLDSTRFDTIDCCVTPVRSLPETLNPPADRARQMVISADGMLQYAPPFRISGCDFAVDRLAPTSANTARKS